MHERTKKNINEYIEQLEEQNEFKSELISTSAHQMRTSLTANKWALKEILDENAGNVTENQRILLQKLLDNNKQMIHSVSELIDVNHTEDTHPRYNFGPVDLHQLIEKVISDFHSEAVEKDITVSLDETSEHEIIIGDPQKLRTVFQALIENALKYSVAGGSVMVDTDIHEDEVVVSIKDEGIGIPKDEQEHIFQKFYRAKNAQATQAIGSGLGLFSAYHIIQAHGGDMWFDSVENQGTTFFVSIPFPPDEVIVE
jgi:signal transduction histidine kinase